MKLVLVVFVLLCLVSMVAEAAIPTKGTFIYDWNPPKARIGGKALAPEEIGKYQVYWKTRAATDWTIVDLPSNTLKFQMLILFGEYSIKARVCDTEDRCSDFTKQRDFGVYAHPTKPGYTTLTAGKTE